MVNSYLRQSPLAHLHLESRRHMTSGSNESAVSLTEHPAVTQILVRGQSADPAFIQAIEKVLSVALPVVPCTSSGNADGPHILWMGPDEWLIISPDQQKEDIHRLLNNALTGLHAALIDVSESRTVIQLGGPNARHVLAKGCSIDLHSLQFLPGQTVNTLLAKAHITLHKPVFADPTAASVFRIFVARSYAEYLWSWLEDASREYGLENLQP